MPDIFDEVDEDLRAERARKFLTRYGGALVAAAVLLVATVAGVQMWHAREARAAGRVGDDFLAASRIADGPPGGRAAALPAFERVIAEGDSGYRSLARLRAAALKADGGDLAGASMLWDQVADDGGAATLLRDAARLQWAMHQLDGGDGGQVAARLQTLAAPENPYHALAQEAQAVLALRQGKPDAARDTLKQLSADAASPDGVRGRANGLLARLGG